MFRTLGEYGFLQMPKYRWGRPQIYPRRLSLDLNLLRWLAKCEQQKGLRQYLVFGPPAKLTLPSATEMHIGASTSYLQAIAFAELYTVLSLGIEAGSVW